MIKLARILQIDSQKVQLHMESSDSCVDCKNGCSDSFLSFLFPKNTTVLVSKENHLIAESHLSDTMGFFSKDYKQGDIIGIKFREKYFFKLALVLYGMPISLIIISLILFYYLFSVFNLNADLGGFLGLIIGLVISKIILKLNYIKFKPQVEFFK